MENQRSKKRSKIHLSKDGVPLCSVDSRIRETRNMKYDLTLKFDEVTCCLCITMIQKLSRLRASKDIFKGMSFSRV